MTAQAPLLGLVLAGGESRRMRQDKGALDYHGRPQVEHCHALLTACCGEAYVSVSSRQAELEPYRGLPLIVDEGQVAGPAAGLLAAWARRPEAAWLVLAVDLPFVDAPLLARLIEHRDAAAAATAFVHAGGTLEPVCAIWEPGARPALVRAAAADGPVSLRRILESIGVAEIEAPPGGRIESANTPRARAEALRTLARRGRGSGP